MSQAPDRIKEQLDIATAALRDIADGMRVPNAMLESKEVFREFFAPHLQRMAREALASIADITEPASCSTTPRSPSR